jgi:hypothetical protein
LQAHLEAKGPKALASLMLKRQLSELISEEKALIDEFRINNYLN